MSPRARFRSHNSRAVGIFGRVGRWTLVFVILCLALIGLLHITRGTAVRQVRGVAVDGVPINVSEPEFPLMATMATGAWLAPGNRVEVTLNGDGTYPRLWEDLRSAQQSITLQLYYGAPGRMADTLGQILIDRAQAGVRVLVLYDAFGAADIPKDHRDRLRAVGIVAEPFRPIRLSTLHLAQHRSHVRGIVIDSRVGWTGGFGIDDKWLGDGRTNGSWRETNVRFEGPAVRQLQAAFAAAWVEATGVMFTGRATAGPPTDVQVVRFAGRAWYDRLLTAGVRVYEWQPTTLHAKTFVVDGEWFTVGSMNFDNRSMALNDEATLMVLDRTGGQEMNRIFLDDLEQAEEITRDAFGGRSWLQRIAEWGANALTRLL